MHSVSYLATARRAKESGLDWIPLAQQVPTGRAVSGAGAALSLLAPEMPAAVHDLVPALQCSQSLRVWMARGAHGGEAVGGAGEWKTSRH